MMLTRSFLAIASWCCLLVVAQQPATVSAFTTTSHGRTTWTTDQQQQQPGLHMATWSDSKAVMDYQAFLSSGKQELELAKDMPSVIIQPQDTPSLWAQCLQEMGQGQDLVLHPGMDLPETVQGATEYPIYIALPPTQLNDFLQNLRPSYKEGGHQDDFVFLSGGYEHGNIEHVLQARGYCRDQMTQVVVSGLHVAPNGRPQDLSVNLGLDSQGEAKIANKCTACGKWAGAVAERLQRNQIPCETDFYREWRRKMWERHVLDACFHVLGVVREQQPTTLADVANYYEQEASDMVWEMSQLLRGWKALTLMYGFEERIFGTAEMRGTETPCQLSDDMYEFLWGNQVFLQSKMFCDYLSYAKTEKGQLPQTDLPQRADEEFASKMRQGNLRADGVL